MTKTDPKKSEEMKPISFRLKPSVAERIKEIAYHKGINNGEVIESLLYAYEHHDRETENVFLVGTLNRLTREQKQPFKVVPFSGKVIFRSPRVEYKAALPYADMLTEKFGLENFDFSDCVVGSTISVAELESDFDYPYEGDAETLLIHERLIIKKREESDFLFCSQWVRSASTNDSLMTNVSPFVCSNDIIYVDTLYADMLEWEEAEEYAPDFD